MGAGPRRGLSRLGYPGSLGGRPASLLSIPIPPFVVRTPFRPQWCVPAPLCPFPLPLSTWLACAVPFFFPAVCVVFLRFVWSYSGCPLLFLFGLFTVTLGKSLVVVKHLKGGNAFNHRNPARNSAVTEADGLPPLQLRSTLSPGTGIPCTSQPSLCARVLLKAHKDAIAVAGSASASRKRKALEWTPQPGCGCGSAAVHTKHVKKCARWACRCKLPNTGRGGNNTHHPECMRARYAQHMLPFAAGCASLRKATSQR